MRLSRLLCLVAAASLAGPLAAAPIPRYLPEDSEVVVGLEIGPFLESATAQKYLPALLSKPGRLFPGVAPDEGRKAADGLKEFLGLTDPKRLAAFKQTVERVMMAGPFAAGEPGFLWIVEGKFDAAKMKEIFELVAKKKPLGAALEAKTVGDRELYTLTVSGAGPIYLAIADDAHLLLSGSRKRVEDGLAHADGAPTKARGDLLELVGKADAAQPIWFAAVLAKDENIDRFSGGISLDRGLKGQLTAVAKNADIAQRLAEQLLEKKKDFAALPDVGGQLAVVGLAILRHFNVTTREATLTFTVDLTDAQLSAILLAEE